MIQRKATAQVSEAVVESDLLRNYMIGSYNTMRLGMAAFAAGFPIAVWISGAFYGKKLPGSLSAYYWLLDTEPNHPRIVFVGGLFAMALFFFVYKGFSPKEDKLLNVAAFCAVGVALVPKSHGSWDPGYWHAGVAIALFVCLACVIRFCAGDTLEELEKSGNAPKEGPYSVAWHQKRYRLISYVMVLSPLIAGALDLSLGGSFGDPDLGKLGTTIFFVEAVGIWVFGWYWLLKSQELRRATDKKEPEAGAAT